VSTDRAFAPAVPYDQLELNPFRELPPAVWSRELYLADALVDAMVTLRCREILGRIDPRRLPDSRQFALRWMRQRIEDGPLDWSEDALLAAAETVRAGPTFALIDLAARNYAGWLSGDVDGNAVLFSREALALWEAYFNNDNVAYGPVNELGAEAVARATDGRPLRILEVGTGCGSGSEALLTRLAGQVRSYCATDAAPVFLARARRRIGQRFPDPISFARLDLNLPLSAQGLAIPAAGFDLIYAVNTLHAVRDLLFSLRELGGLLASDGILALAEGVRPRRDYSVPIEFLFLLTSEFGSVQIEPDFRPRGGFLYHDDWRVALARAGFSSVRFTPDMPAAIAAYPTYAMAAVIARR